MPGRLFLTHSAADLTTAFGVAWPADADLPRIEVSPGEEIPGLIESDSGPVWRSMRWSMIMSGRTNARGRPVMETIVNARSETVFSKSAFEGVRRAVLPASGWYEWTGKTRRKTRWRMQSVDGHPLALAAIWDVWEAPGGTEIAQCAVVTCEPNADVKDYHHRMALLLPPDQIKIWLEGSEDEVMDLLRVPEDGTIAVDEARDVKDLIGH